MRLTVGHNHLKTAAFILDIFLHLNEPSVQQLFRHPSILIFFPQHVWIREPCSRMLDWERSHLQRHLTTHDRLQTFCACDAPVEDYHKLIYNSFCAFHASPNEPTLRMSSKIDSGFIIVEYVLKCCLELLHDWDCVPYEVCTASICISSLFALASCSTAARTHHLLFKYLEAFHRPVYLTHWQRRQHHPFFADA